MASVHDPHLLNLRAVVQSNLQLQHYWTDIKPLDALADQSDASQLEPLPRPMLYGRPPDQLYDPEPAPLSTTDSSPKPAPEMEYVLPVHLDETFTLRKWAAIFDALPKPSDSDLKKRIVVAVVSGDSTVVYYIMHDGIVKPRQN
ncbi:hypothetical protein DRE_00702 [Drechslerella stenobrocha 248]|uniref:tRNA-splicing endonuclease subunit Sen15 domain-containing protein n=1 Tax=Drechslerella stenobrocha 248 TaxID=1043628 RepID=W7HZC7_9PEZI|nr:hypothetical protein DRE_00702 [Drechslerella stenobrocha 248]